MPRITITVSESTLSAMDDFALHVGKSRSVVCASVLDMVVPMLGYLKTTYDLAKSGDTEGMQTFVGSIGDLLQDVSGQYESLLGDFAEPAEGVNPRSCNNGGQVSQDDHLHDTQRCVFIEKSGLKTPPSSQGGSDA